MPGAAASDPADLIARGQRELAEGRWSEAAETLGAALALGDDPDAAFGRAVAEWWLAETDQAMRGWEAAYVLYRQKGQPIGAVMAAFYLCFAYQMSYGNTAAARGWLSRAARVAAQPGAEEAVGWVSVARAHMAIDEGQPRDGERWAREAATAAAKLSDVDLELCAASELGAALVEQGRTQEGNALLDEAMAAALAGEARDRDAVVLISCRTITASSRAGDLRRVVQWVSAADAFHQRYGSPHLYVTCRSQYGAVLVATGRWADAERELHAALEMSHGAETAVRGDALASLAELRVAQGRVDEAERLLAGFEGHPAAILPIAMVALVRGDARTAVGVLRRRLHRMDPATIEASRVHDLHLQAQLAAGDRAGAARTADILATIAATTGSAAVTGRARRGIGRLEANADNPAAAADHLMAAVDAFDRADLPLEAARTRLLFATTVHRADPDGAVAEARAGLASLDRLGAAPDADEAAALLRSFGVRALRSAEAATGALSRRELEVLRLIRDGLSNREIADRLFITRKTVEHHVANVLAKVGLSGRTEAAAWAVRHLDGAPAERPDRNR